MEFIPMCIRSLLSSKALPLDGEGSEDGGASRCMAFPLLMHTSCNSFLDSNILFTRPSPITGKDVNARVLQSVLFQRLFLPHRGNQFDPFRMEWMQKICSVQHFFANPSPIPHGSHAIITANGIGATFQSRRMLTIQSGPLLLVDPTPPLLVVNIAYCTI